MKNRGRWIVFYDLAPQYSREPGMKRGRRCRSLSQARHIARATGGYVRRFHAKRYPPARSVWTYIRPDLAPLNPTIDGWALETISDSISVMIDRASRALATLPEKG